MLYGSAVQVAVLHSRCTTGDADGITNGGNAMQRYVKYLMLIAAIAVIGVASYGCGGKNPVSPQSNITSSVPNGYRIVYQDSTVQIGMPSTTSDVPNFEAGMVDTSSRRAALNQAQATWVMGTRLRYYWDADHDFRIEYRTPRSCCYRVSYTYALYYVLKLVNKPLIVYSIGTNADGSINWRIIVGGSAVQWMSPISDWILAAQAEMQSYN